MGERQRRASRRGTLVVGSVAAAAALAWLPGAGSAAGVRYPNFSSVAGLKVNGDAAKAGDVLRLTPASGGNNGSAFTKRKVVESTKSFKTRFRVSLHDDGGVPGDGLAFVLHGDGAGTTGDGGGGIGYGGVDPSLAVEIDTFFNAGEAGDNGDPDSNHIAVVIDGEAGDARKNASIPYPLGAHESLVWVDYSAKRKRLKVFAAETNSKPATPFINIRLNVRNLFDGDRVRAGFTASTGFAYEAHDVLSWKLKQRR